MNRSMHLSLRAGERIFINGAVLRVDRKVTIELLNDATFLLENHVLQVEEAATPLRQLYFVAQAMLIDPSSSDKARTMFRDLQTATRQSFENENILSGLASVSELIEAGRTFDALKILRSLFSTENDVLTGGATKAPTQAA
ncbi:flagellar biosynthesis repressor FlbT [Microvirga flavescens]|uniref:flagellar biosynthesis repressor FlbT n=1 Tax=Microvirga flavescens TaxID=2249811 RepID=UPI001FE0E307|nr:flagellar biosynthesis repressor FlbT [Microvirga flavescens]